MTSRPRVILAEDDPSVATALTRVLKTHFDLVTVVSEGSDLVERVLQLVPDVVVTDVYLEGLDGLSACARIHELCPTIPIVVISGAQDPRLGFRAFHAGAAAFLSKGEGPEKLVSVVHALVSRARGEGI